METVGVFLKKEREARNISLKEVSRMTKISEIYLDCIEKDDYDKLPQGPYIKGYISTYSRLIGSNVEEALKLYDSLNKRKPQAPPLQPPIKPGKGWKTSIRSSLKSIVASLNGSKKNGRQHSPDKGDPPDWPRANAFSMGASESPGNGPRERFKAGRPSTDASQQTGEQIAPPAVSSAEGEEAVTTKTVDFLDVDHAEAISAGEVSPPEIEEAEPAAAITVSTPEIEKAIPAAADTVTPTEVEKEQPVTPITVSPPEVENAEPATANAVSTPKVEKVEPAAAGPSVFQKWGSTVATRASSLTKAGPSIKHAAVAVLDKGTASLKAIASGSQRATSATAARFKRAASTVAASSLFSQRRAWLLNGSLAIVGVVILVLAGFGAYHLFVFEREAPALSGEAAQQETRAAAAKPTPATSAAEPPRLSPKTAKPANPPKPVSLPQPAPVKATSPAVAKQAPAVPKQEPAVTKQEPAVTKQEPAVTKQEPAVTKQAPAVPKQAPAVPKQEPAEKADAGSAAVVEQKTETPTPNAVADSHSEAPATDGNLSVLKATICSSIENRMPADVTATFPASIQRVYVWNHLEAKTYPTKVRHIYYFKGQVYNDVTLEVRSPSWRTWSFKSIAEDRYRGEWQVDIASVDGTVLRRLFFRIE